MTNTGNKAINELILSKKEDIKQFTKKYLDQSYKHLSTEGLILSPLVLKHKDLAMYSETSSRVREFLHSMTKYLLASEEIYAKEIRKSVSAWGNQDLVSKIYAASITNGSIDDYTEIGRLDLMYDQSSEINPNCIDSLMDYKELEMYLLELWDKIGVPIKETHLQTNLLDRMLDELIHKTLSQNVSASHIGWLGSHHDIYKKYWPREKRLQEYANSYLKSKGISLEFSLVSLEDLSLNNIQKFGALYNMIYPDALGKIADDEVLRAFLKLSEENRLISPYFTYPIEHKSIQALIWKDDFMKARGVSRQDIEFLRGAFPKTLIVSEELKENNFDNLISQYSDHYIKDTYSWMGEGVFKAGKLSKEKMATILKDIEKNPLHWILQAPAEHLQVSHIEYNVTSGEITEKEMIADSGIQYVYSPKRGVSFVSVSSRNSISQEGGIVTSSFDNVFRPAAVVFK